MMRLWISLHVFLVLMLVVSPPPADADTYTWVDEQSTVHYTDDPGSVPELFRKSIRKLDDSVPSQADSAAEVKDEKMSNAPLSGEGTVAKETYDGKSYDQWAKELADREAAMTAVIKLINDKSGQIMLLNLAREEKDKLLAERQALVMQFNEMKAEYFQRVEIARKAGLKINIEQ